MSRLRRAALGAGAAAVFVLLATGNSGGYRYGVGDQAFYIPAILADAQPGLFPRDHAVFAAQERLLAFDELAAGAMAATPLSLPAVFATLYVLTLVLALAGLAGIGRALYRQAWSVVALAAAATLRHAVAAGAVNTLEGYLHPRMLVWGLGLTALAAWLRGRLPVALALVVASLAVHPTTGLFFVIWIGAAAVVDEPRTRRWLLPAAAAGGAAGAVLLLFPASGSPRVMDVAWIDVFARKAYLFPDQWRPDVWLVQLAYPLVTIVLYRWRARLGLVVPRERGLVLGSLVLVGVFLVLLPLVAMRVTFAVQLQVARVFWMADFMAIAYLIWLLAESPLAARTGRPGAMPAIVAAILVVASAARAGYLTSGRDRPLVRIQLAGTPWTEALAWVDGHTPLDAHLLLDPAHVWAVGASARIAARRDVLLEDDKDTSMAFYSRDLAMRIAERRQAIGAFEAMDEGRALALARRYDLHYLVSSHRLDLPAVYDREGIRVYSLSPVASSAAP